MIKIKRKIAFFLIFITMLLGGCGKENNKNKDTNEQVETLTDATDMDATTTDGTIKERTDYKTISESDWAVKDNLVNDTDNLYQINITEIADTYGIVVDMAAYGDNVIALYCNSDDNNYLYEIEPYNMYIVRQVMLPAGKYDKGSLCLFEDELYVLDTKNNQVYFYDYKLEHIRTVALGDKTTVNMVKSDNSKNIYYFDNSRKGIYQVDLSTGEEKQLFPNEDFGDKTVELVGVASDDQLLVYTYTDNENKIYNVRYIATGEVVKSGNADIYDMENIGEEYTLRYSKDGFEHILCGNIKDAEPKVVSLYNYYSYLQDENYPNNKSNTVYVKGGFMAEYAWEVIEPDSLAKGTVILNDTKTGETRGLELLLDEKDYKFSNISDMVYLKEENYIIFAITNLSTKLYIWDLDEESSKPLQNVCNVFDLHELDYYDEETEEYLIGRAENIGRKYDVSIAFGQNSNSIFDGVCDISHNSVMINLALNTIEQEYQKYPEGMLKQLDDGYGGILNISLTGKFNDGWSTGSHAAGMGESNIALDIYQYDMFRVLHHETFHAIEAHITYVGGTFDTDQWKALNPEGFRYENNYSGGADHTGVGDYFMYSYGKNFSNEDRATIMEYVMIENQHFNGFIGKEHLNAKLAYICERIRNSFDTSGWPEVTYWESKIN